MQSSYSIEFGVFSDSSDTSCVVYLRVAFMTVFALLPEAIIHARVATIKTTTINW